MNRKLATRTDVTSAGARLRLGLVVLAVMTLAACAPALTSFAPAHVGPKGAVKAAIGVDVVAPSGTIGDAFDTARTLALASRNRTLSEEEKNELVSSAVKSALHPPALVQHFGVAYNPADDWEGSLQYAGGAFRLGGRHQILHRDRNGIDLSAGLGLSRFSYGLPLDDFIDVIDVDDFTRWTLDVPITLGRQGEFFRWWTGPRLAFVRHSAQLVVRLPAQGGEPAHDEVARASGDGTYIGYLAGLAFGYRNVFLAFELSVARHLGSAELNVFGRTLSADTNATIFSPGIALLGEF